MKNSVGEVTDVHENGVTGILIDTGLIVRAVSVKRRLLIEVVVVVIRWL